MVGLGYVGLPLAVEFGKKFRTIGVDLSAEKIACYKQHFDPTGEVNSDDLKAATLLEVGTDPALLQEADFVIVAVPTPVCIPILEQHSGKKWKTDFFVGYSPERINPGDKERTVTKIV